MPREVDKHFAKSNLKAIINRNTVKLSYCCMPNMKMIIAGQASKKLRNFRDSEANNATNNKRLCNCRQANSCPVNGNCLMECVIYKATITVNNIAKHYFGLTEGHFKDRWD